MDIKETYELWVEKAVECDAAELAAYASDEAALKDAFRQELAFGTAGLRGILGAGPNRMNVYTVGKATQGLADYLNANFEKPSVAIARDSRNCGQLFVNTVACILAANGIKACVYPRIMPTPALSFAVRDLHCSAGINVTASHNPAEYNGYKVYGPDGCQITVEMTKGIQAAIDAVDPFEDIRKVELEAAYDSGLIEWVTEETVERFLDAVQEQSLVMAAEKEEVAPDQQTKFDPSLADYAAPGDPDGLAKSNIDPATRPQKEIAQPKDISLVYTPLNGTGLECVSAILDRIELPAVNVVPEQAQPDGNFPTCTYPNPEAREALTLGIELAEKINADLVLATDPDADRVGIAVAHNGEYVLLTGNEVGALLLDFAAQVHASHGEDLSRKVGITTIVSSAMADSIAAEHGFQLRRTLTGFKWIGEQIALLEAAGQPDRYMFGFEESYGYLAGTHVRDKDAIVASMLICQLARYYRSIDMDLVEAVEQLYAKHGYCLNRTVSLSFPGADGAQKMLDLTAGLRAEAPAEIAGFAVEGVTDYKPGAPMPIINALADEPAQMLPSADVIEYRLAGGHKFIVRPSGTEPKIKAYLFVKGASRADAEQLLDTFEAAAREMLA